jgi:hypothetical protein
LVYVIYLDSGVYIIKCNIRLEFLWKFNVVLNLYGLKKLRREGRPMGSRERLETSDPLETSSFFLLVMARILVATSFDLVGHMLKASG